MMTRQVKYRQLLAIAVLLAVCLVFLAQNDQWYVRSLKDGSLFEKASAVSWTNVLRNEKTLMQAQETNKPHKTPSAHKETITSTITGRNISTVTYVRAVRHLPDERLFRVVALRECTNKQPLMAIIQYDQNRTIELKTRIKSLQYCPWPFNKHCTINAHLIDASYKNQEAKVQKALHSAKLLNFSLKSSTDHITPIGTVTEVIERVSIAEYKQTRKHFLAVCVQPLYYYTEWVQLVQFMELWIVNGATQFFIYVQSMTQEVAALLDIYQQENLVTLVDWPQLPDENDNERIYRTGVIAAINDCNERAAAVAEFVAHVDLDEIIVPFKHKTVTEFIESLGAKYPKLSSLVFRSANAHLQVPDSIEPQEANAFVPLKSISFDYLAHIERETFIYPRGARSKIITRPSLMESIHVHDYIRAEQPNKTINRAISTSAAIVLHMRRVRSKFALETNGTESVNLSNWSEQATENFYERLRKYDLIEVTLPYRGISAMQEYEQCVNALFDRRNKECSAVVKCEQNITSVPSTEWIGLKAQHAWTVVS